jgi:hypothetical protein
MPDHMPPPNIDEIKRKLPSDYRYRPAIPHPVTMRKPTPLGFAGADLRPSINQLGLSIRTQVGGAPCAVHAFTFLLEYQHMKHVWPDLSEEYLQYVTFQIEKPQMTGGENFWALNIGYQTWGAVPQSYVPNGQAIPASIPSSVLDIGKRGVRLTQTFIKTWDPTTGATPDQLNEVTRSLDHDVPVAAGLLWPVSFRTNSIGGVDLMEVPSSNNKWDVVFDGHAIALVGYQTGPVFPGHGYFIFRNSWSVDWGDHGYGYMPFDYILKYANDLLVFKLPTA